MSDELTAILDHIKALDKRIMTAEDISKITRQIIAEQVKATPEPLRRQHLEADASLKGSRFSAYGLNEHDIEFAHGLMVAARNFKPYERKCHPSEALENAYKAIAAKNGWGAVVKANDAADTAESGFASQLIETGWISEMWMKLRLVNKLYPLIPFVPMSTGTIDIPIDGALPEMMLFAESTASNSSNYTTSLSTVSKKTLTAKKFGVHQMWSGELEEDSIVPWVPFLRAQLEKAVGYYVDSLILNGDTETGGTGNINNDDGAPTATKHYLGFNGLRKLGLVTNTANRTDKAGAATASDWLALLKLMTVWGGGLPQDVPFVCSLSDYLEALNFDEIVTVDKYGPAATILTGEMGKLFNHPVIVSEAMKLTETDGKIDIADDGTKGQIVAFNRNGWLGGTRREGKLEFERIPASDQSRLVFTTRLALVNWDNEVSATLYDITV